MHRTFQLRHNAAEDRPIELAQYEPFRATGCACERPNRRYVKSALAHGFEGTRTRFEGQRERFHNFRILMRRRTV